MNSLKTNKSNPTLQDVASEASVSTATASRALSTPDQVSDHTRKRVDAAVIKLGYVLNHAARNLRRQKTGTIVALVPDIGNPHFSNILQGIETACAEKKLKVLIADTRKPSMADQMNSDYFSQANCDGIICLDGHISIAAVRERNPKLPPIVMAGEWSNDPEVPNAMINNVLGATLATTHLIELGHTRIGHVTGSLTHKPGSDRLQGFRATLESHNLDPDQAWFYEGDYDLSVGSDAAEVWLKSDKKPTAVFCASDLIAIGFISRLHEAGVSVPKDVSVVGYDNIDIAGHFIPHLTTIHQPRRAVGEKAAKLLLNLMENGAPDKDNKPLDPWIVVRKSTAPANQS